MACTYFVQVCRLLRIRGCLRGWILEHSNSWKSKLPSIVVRRTAKGNTFLSTASGVLIVHSPPLFTNWFALWTARCDQPQMWLHIPAFGAYVISFNSSITLHSGFSPAPFVRMSLSHPLSLRLLTWSLIPAYTCAFWLGSPHTPRQISTPVTKHCKSICCF